MNYYSRCSAECCYGHRRTGRMSGCQYERNWEEFLGIVVPKKLAPGEAALDVGAIEGSLVNRVGFEVAGAFR